MEFNIEINQNNQTDFSKLPFEYIFENSNKKVYFFGDAILPIKTPVIDEIDAQWIIDNIKGHYYFIIHSLDIDQIIIGNSNFSILPLYFSKQEDNVYISSKVEIIAKKLNIKTINKRFILENVLFNYQLFNETIYKEIKLFPSNQYIEITNSIVEFKSYKPIEDYFVKKPIPWRKSVNKISDLFIKKSKVYFPNEEYATSLTGGFDGRTLVSLGTYFNKKCSTYSFGSSSSSDFSVAKDLSAKLNIEFHPFYLNDVYTDKSLELGLDFIKGSEGCASFARAHYLYSIKELQKKYKYIITGNFGSEVFRAAHIAGAVLSQNLYNIFIAKDYDESLKLIEDSLQFKYLNKDEFIQEWEDLALDIKSLPPFNSSLKKFSKNEQFYKFVFEEVFRKYFGAEMVNQYQFLKNRTPFLDFDFIKEILKTELSGVYSDFFTHNPFKRFKGQVVYSHILKKTNKILFEEYTDKGYRPKDLLSFMGKINITKGFIKKKLIKKKFVVDPYAVRESFKSNISYWQDLEIDEKLFNQTRINDMLNNQRDFHSLEIVLSQVWYLNYIKKI